MTSTLIIAEAGVNHNGDVGLALELVDAAAKAGADVVKFQTFSAERIASRKAPKADYQVVQTGGAESQLEMLKRLELPIEAFRQIQDRCRERGVAFLSTAGDVESADLLMGELGLDCIKIGSGDLTNAPLLWAIAAKGRKVMLSTGMSTLSDVEEALTVLAAAYLTQGRTPESFAAMREHYFAPQAEEALAANVQVLHCTTEYPAAPETVNLAAMDTLRDAFGLETGYSDHTEGHAVSVAAVARGATIIEKHFTLDRTMEGPDHQASLDPAGFAAMVEAIRVVEQSIGSRRKAPVGIELKNRQIVRKSLVAARPIAAGQTIQAEDLAVRRPANGRPPRDWWSVVGSAAARDYAADEPID